MSEFIIFNTKDNSGNKFTIEIGNNVIHMSEHVKILFVYLDTAMTLEKQISTTCRTAYMQIRRINSIRQYLTESAAKTIIQMMVVSRLDYCNSLYRPISRVVIGREVDYRSRLIYVRYCLKNPTLCL